MGDESLLTFLQHLHTQSPYSRALLASGRLAEDVEWRAVGRPEVLPWAGTFRGPAGVKEFFERLNGTMSYTDFEAIQYLTNGDTVVVIIKAGGYARATKKAFASEIVRIYTFRDGMIVRVRNYYDTAAYEAALER